MDELCRLRQSDGYEVCFDARAVGLQSLFQKAKLSEIKKSL